MKYLVFNTEQEAIAAEQSISKSLGLPKHGINAKTGQVDLNSVIIQKWSDVILLNDGRFAIPSPDDSGIELNSSLLIKEEAYP